MVLAATAFAALEDFVQDQKGTLAVDVVLLAPVQQAAAAMSVEVGNVTDKTSVGSVIGFAWPALLALAVWAYRPLTERLWFRNIGVALCWTLAGWAVLRFPNGAPAFLMMLAVFFVLHVVVPALRQLWQLPRRPAPTPLPAPDAGAAPTAAAALILVAFIWSTSGSAMAGPTIPKGLEHSAHGR